MCISDIALALSKAVESKDTDATIGDLRIIRDKERPVIDIMVGDTATYMFFVTYEKQGIDLWNYVADVEYDKRSLDLLDRAFSSMAIFRRADIRVRFDLIDMTDHQEWLAERGYVKNVDDIMKTYNGT